MILNNHIDSIFFLKSQKKKTINNKGNNIRFFNNKINFNLNLYIYKQQFNRNFLKVKSINKRKSLLNKIIVLKIKNIKYNNLIINSIISFSKKLGEDYIKVPYMFFSNNLSYTSSKFIAKKLWKLLFTRLYARIFRKFNSNNK